MRKIVLLIICLFVSHSIFAQCPDPGTMPSDEKLVCAENSVNLTSSNFSLGMGDVLVYAVHTSATGTAGDILAVSGDGNFNFADLSGEASYNTEYYVSAIAGPDNDGDGIPDLNDPCVRIATGTPTVFLAPIVLDRWADCNLEDGSYILNFTISGGLPEYDSGSNYNVFGTFAANLSYSQAQEGRSAPLSENDEYNFEVLDGFCSGMANGSVTCTKCPAEDAAGTMSQFPRYSCIGGSLSSVASNPNFDAARAQLYALHLGSDTSLVNVIGYNETGEFQYDDVKEDVVVGQRYYISSVIALKDENNEPILTPSGPDDDICLKVAVGTPVAFVSPIEVTVVENCNPETGIASLTVSAEGGAPGTDNSEIYTIQVGNTDFALLSNGTLTQGSYMFGDNYTVIATDTGGCDAEFSGTIECQLVDSAPSLETPNFKLNYIAPMPISDRAILDFTAKMAGEVAVQVFGVNGQLVHAQDFRAEIGDNKIEMDVAHLNSGMYFLQLSTIEGLIASKLMKE